VQRGFQASDSTVTIFVGCHSTTWCLGLRETHWREHVHDMLLGTDSLTAPAFLLDPITARQFVERGGFDTKEKLADWAADIARMPAKVYWDLQLIQNYVYPRAVLGNEPTLNQRLTAAPDELISIFNPEDISVVVVGGEANGYWQIMGAKAHRTISIDDWR
jgi:hypothetical protein